MKACITGFILLFSLLVFSPVQAADSWEISNFESTLILQTDGVLEVREIIAVNFNSEVRHGIYRDIPLAYDSDNGTIYTDIDVLSVTNGVDPLIYKVEDQRRRIRIQIGDPNRQVTGRQQYVLTYTVKGVIRSFDQFDELYWNVTGGDWEVPIRQSSATVILPEPDIVQTACYPSCEITRLPDGSTRFAAGELPGSSPLTVAVGFRKGLVPILPVTGPLSPLQILFSWKTLLTFLLIALPATIYLLRNWWRNGRDLWWRRASLHDPDATIVHMPFGAHETIVPEYEPPLNLRPAELGVLIDERADTVDVTATIVDLAIRGFITIEEIPKRWLLGSTDYLLRRTKKSADKLLQYEQTLLSRLFKDKDEYKVSELRNKFYDSMQTVKEEIYETVLKKGLFVSNPAIIRNRFLGIGLALLIMGGIAVIPFFTMANSYLLGAALASIFTGLLVLILSFAMPQKTAEGREALRKAKGYRLFLSNTEKYRQPFFEKQNIFMDILPYAILFGVTEKLAKSFAKMGIEPPTPGWYVGTHAFAMGDFGKSMESFAGSLSASVSSTPGSGGGGFSGGGFGGGGGGSW